MMIFITIYVVLSKKRIILEYWKFVKTRYVAKRASVMI